MRSGELLRPPDAEGTRAPPSYTARPARLFRSRVADVEFDCPIEGDELDEFRCAKRALFLWGRLLRDRDRRQGESKKVTHDPDFTAERWKGSATLCAPGVPC